MMNKFKFFALCLTAVLLLSSCGIKNAENLVSEDILMSGTTENDLFSADYMNITENEKVSLWFNKDTTSVKVVDKSNGYEWYSCLQDQTDRGAPFTLTYVSSTGLIETMDAMTGSIVNGQYEYERIENGISVTYSIGDFSGALLVPLAIGLDRMEFVLGNIEDDFQKSQFESMYQLTDVQKMDEENKKKFLQAYPSLENGPLYILRETITSSETKMKNLAKLLGENGYTEEMYNKDSLLFNLSESEEKEEKPGFRISIKYTLAEDGITVKIPYEEIQMKPSCPILGIELNKYMGSPNFSDSGYFLLPDGSGSLMNFYNGKGDLQDYNTKIYGLDYAALPDERVYDFEQAYFPIWAVKNGDQAMFAVIEEGDAIAEINAFPGNELLNAYAAPTFNIRSYQKTYLNSSSKDSNYFVNIQNERYKGNIVVRYVFLSDDNADLDGMASWYRDYLFDDEKTVEQQAPGMLLESVGLLNKQSQAVGISFVKDIVATTFEQTENIAIKLKDSDIKNLSVKVSGWSNGAYYGRFSDSVRINKQLGGKAAFSTLSEALKTNGIGFYPDVNLQYTYDTGWLDRFSASKDAVSLISGAVGHKLSYNPATFVKDQKYQAVGYINNLSAVDRIFNNFFDEYKDLSINSVSLNSVGREISADYSDKNGTDRQTFANSISDSVKNISQNYNVMVNGANAYILNSSDYCVDVPLKSNERDNTDESVPFLHMVISGKVRYSGPAMNLTGGSDSVILRMAAVAADIHYVVAAEHSEDVVNSDYSFLYSSNYDYLEEDMIAAVREYQKNMDGLSGRKIIGYEKLADHLYRTLFEDNASVTVNYGTVDVSFEDHVYAAKSYTVDIEKEGIQ